MNFTLCFGFHAVIARRTKRNEAIHNHAQNGFYDGETLDYRFVQCRQTAKQRVPRSCANFSQ
ncbi:hypothetical protein [Helicobacter sp. MIT 05-5294]|uniref:hypothetical protein n=1 Tax=Helicobacter sp. MIT 05-5294 TaxID=1548150 RepID=UPI000A3FBDF0|nr:hypothetical protein [Helicobacter sp. MIT 05-5294]TLD85961.1 hypothetical protein LS69_007280 [Helicobacter sp. MIT 05-5294]